MAFVIKGWTFGIHSDSFLMALIIHCSGKTLDLEKMRGGYC